MQCFIYKMTLFIGHHVLIIELIQCGTHWLNIYYQEELVKFLSPMLAFIDSHIQAGQSVLVHCLAGAHRQSKIIKITIVLKILELSSDEINILEGKNGSNNINCTGCPISSAPFKLAINSKGAIQRIFPKHSCRFWDRVLDNMAFLL